MSDPIITDADVLDLRRRLEEAHKQRPLGWPIPGSPEIAGWPVLSFVAVRNWLSEREDAIRAGDAIPDQPEILDDWARLCAVADPGAPDPLTDPDPWEGVHTQRGQLAAIEEWTDAGQAKRALAYKVQAKVAPRLEMLIEDLGTIAWGESLLARATTPGEIPSGLSIRDICDRTRPRPTAATLRLATDLLARIEAAKAAPVQRAFDEARALVDAEQKPASQVPETPAADLVEQRLQLRSEQWRGGDDPELVALLRAIPPLSDVLECGADVSSADAIARAVLEIEGLRRKIDRQAEEAADLRIEIDNLRAALSSREKQVANFALLTAPSWYTTGDGLSYSAPPPPILARVEPDLDEPIWHWSVGDTIGRKRGTAPSQEDAQKICDLFLGDRS